MAEAKSRHLDFRPDEYISGVAAKLTAEEQGVYWMICSLIMSRGGPIEYDPKHIGRLVCLSRAKANNIIKRLIKIGKITENGSLLGQKRAEKEVKSALKRIENSQNNGSKGGRPRKENNDLGKPTGLLPKKLTTNTPTDKPPTHIIEGDKPPKTKRKTGKRISEDWELSQKDIEYAKSKGYSDEQITELSEQFLNHWLQATGKGSTSLDWGRQWIKWIGNDTKWNGDPRHRNNGNVKNPGNGKSGNTEYGETAREIGARMDAARSEQPQADFIHDDGEQRTDLSDDGPFIEHDDPGNWNEPG